jgi:hypothetical protein
LVINKAIKETAGTIFAGCFFCRVVEHSSGTNIPADAGFKFHTAGAQGQDKRDTCGERTKS